MSGYREWLPENALFDGKLEDAFNENATTGLAHWFLQPLQLTIFVSRSFRQRDSAEPIVCWTSPTEPISVVLDDKGWRLLIGEFLAIPVGKKKVMEQDRKVGNQLVDKFMRDVCRLGQDFFELDELQWSMDRQRGEPNLAEGGAFFFSLIWGDGTPLCHFVVNEKLVVRARRRLSGMPKPENIDIHPIARGLDHQCIKVGALTGRAELLLSDLEDLSVGDVVVLDQPLSSPLVGTVNGVFCEGLSGLLQQTDNTLQFRVLAQEEQYEHV